MDKALVLDTTKALLTAGYSANEAFAAVAAMLAALKLPN